jgi:hypothetical protein
MQYLLSAPCSSPRKVKLVPVFKHYAMKTYGGVDVQTRVFLTSALVGGERSDLRPCRRSRKIIYLESRARPCVGLTTLPIFVSRLSRQCGILDISQPCKPQVTGIALHYGDGVFFL